jgi:tRNA pseudouridine38-40 synthase
MSRYFIHMAYDGSNYSGWQVQPRELTVQEVLQKALSTLLRHKITVSGAGRTDTGVHASHFVAHFDLNEANEVNETIEAIEAIEATLPEDKSPALPYNPLSEQFIFKLNRFLPPDIVIYKIRKVPGDMHARYSANYRTYQYHISSLKPLYNRNYCHYVFGKLDIRAIRRCCGLLLETTDFTSFARLHSDVKTNICKVSHAEWRKVENGHLFEITADRFLRNMVRSITGTLLDVGRGKLDPDGFQKIIEAKNRGKAGSSAPAKGLFLIDIGYNFPDN